MYRNEHGTITENYPDAYLNIYPVSSESIPMFHFYPNGIFLLISTIGCNFTCEGCISEFQTTRPGSLQEVLTSHTPEEILAIARENGCIGVTFCLNEPTVSLPTFLRVARAAKQNGLLVGCSSNGYMTEWSLAQMIPTLDFVNIGLKGSSDMRYRECGVISGDPVFRNMRILHDAGVFVEVSVMYLAGKENEIFGAAERIRTISPEIPFQLMRFVGINEKLIHLEPTKEEGEAVCRQLRQMLDHVYLFNTPATDFLDSICPVCGASIVHRVFFGPMAARILSGGQNGVCRCGYTFKYRGVFSPVTEELPQVLGGYRSIMGAKYICSIFRMLGVSDDTEIDRLCNLVITDGYLSYLQEQKDSVGTFTGMIHHLARLAAREKKADSLLEYVNSVIDEVERRVVGIRKPRVLAVFCHPLSPLYEEKFGNTLVEMAGGISLNREEDFRESVNTEYTVEAFNLLDPEIILISAHFAPSTEIFLKTCQELGITCQAISKGRVYTMDSRHTTGPVGWIIGLLDTANLLHPDVCRYSLEEERERLDGVTDYMSVGNPDDLIFFSSPVP